MRLPFLLSLLFAARAGQPAALNRPLEYMHDGGSRRGTGRGRALREWHRDRATKALAQVDVAQAAESHKRHARLVGHGAALAHADVTLWRRLRNQRKARRQRIRAQGGQA